MQSNFIKDTRRSHKSVLKISFVTRLIGVSFILPTCSPANLKFRAIRKTVRQTIHGFGRSSGLFICFLVVSRRRDSSKFQQNGNGRIRVPTAETHRFLPSWWFFEFRPRQLGQTQRDDRQPFCLLYFYPSPSTWEI